MGPLCHSYLSPFFAISVSLRVNSSCAMRGSHPCVARVDHVPDSEDSGDKSRARPRPPPLLCFPLCVHHNKRSAATSSNRGKGEPPPARSVLRGCLAMARRPGGSWATPKAVRGAFGWDYPTKHSGFLHAIRSPPRSCSAAWTELSPPRFEVELPPSTLLRYLLRVVP
jgi:hypothetical protein